MVHAPEQVAAGVRLGHVHGAAADGHPRSRHDLERADGVDRVDEDGPASGVRARTGTIAADIKKYPYGTIVEIPGYGYGRVEDIGGAIKGEHLDAWFPHHAEALKWGKQTLNVKVWLPK